jgi:hypothetical protein
VHSDHPGESGPAPAGAAGPSGRSRLSGGAGARRGTQCRLQTRVWFNSTAPRGSQLLARSAL